MTYFSDLHSPSLSLSGLRGMEKDLQIWFYRKHAGPSNGCPSHCTSLAVIRSHWPWLYQGLKLSLTNLMPFVAGLPESELPYPGATDDCSGKLIACPPYHRHSEEVTAHPPLGSCRGPSVFLISTSLSALSSSCYFPQSPKATGRSGFSISPSHLFTSSLFNKSVVWA